MDMSVYFIAILKGEYICDLLFSSSDFKTTHPNMFYLKDIVFLSQKQVLSFMTLSQLSHSIHVTVYLFILMAGEMWNNISLIKLSRKIL